VSGWDISLATVRAGCIDIGSNTTRLLVAEWLDGRLVEVHQERAFTHIGRELSASDSIGEGKLAEVSQIVRGQLAVARELGAVQVRAVATAAIRGAANREQFAKAILDAAGLDVEVLSAEVEARLAFCGAAGMLESPVSGDLCVLDVGGGSSELVVGALPDQIRWWRSLELGSGVLADRWLSSDPPSEPELAAARAEVATVLKDCRPPRPALTIAVGGSAASLSRLAGPVLDALALRRALAVLAGRPSSEIAARFEVDPQRVRLLPAGLLILEAVGRLLDATIRVGRGGIREGVLLEALRP
jgi:exopolyphosphatase/guanosine-5'-triphosphate,3'-diphosphate pyrophosphatase